MVYGAQYGAVRPSGMKKKRGRMAPVIEEQAKMGLATKMVTEGKARAQAQKEWEFQKSSREQELANQQRSLAMAKEEAKWKKKMDQFNLGLNVVSTGLEVVDTFTDWLDF
jgi:hypothetical protein